MKNLRLITLATLLAASTVTPVDAQDVAPLYLSISGAGSVSPLTNGEVLVVGQAYNMQSSAESVGRFGLRESS